MTARVESATGPGAGAPAAQKVRLTSLTGARFIAAFLVFLFHAALVGLFDTQGVNDVLLRVFSKTGWIGVSFFFLLSGFVLTWSARPGDRVTSFWRRRFAKILPNHLVTFVIAMVLFAGTASTAVQATNLLLVHAWVPDMAHYFSLNKPNWSLATEAVFYLLFPVFYGWLQKVPGKRLWPLAAGLAATITAIPAIALAALPATPTVPAPDDPAPSLVYWLVYIFPPVRALDFLLGMVLARIVLTGRWPRLRVTPLVALWLACYTGSMFLPAAYGLNAATLVPTALLVPAIAQLDISGRRSFLRNRTAERLGEISFAFYLTQWLVLPGAMDVLGLTGQRFSTPVAALLIVGWLVGTLLASWALYELVEKPGMRLLAKPRRARAAAVRS
ncbi:acyltransferase family protein [Actinokineospora sp. G85]|uniref:acyltransferase family protein n=1 Tax=Actinokineospora sp. G85 TaxID=3406626 RepID=UPI003C78B52B